MDCLEIGNEANRTPAPGDFGAMFVETFKGAGSGGARFNVWFESQVGLRSFVKNCALEPYVDLAEGRGREFAERVARLLAVVSRGERSFAETLEEMNEALDGEVALEWWGSFDGLLHEDSGAAREIRAEFRESEDDRPIDKSQIESFAEFIAARVG